VKNFVLGLPCRLGLALCVMSIAAGGGATGTGLVSAVTAPQFGPERRLGESDKNPSTPFLRHSPDGRLYAIWTEDDRSPAAGARRGAFYGDPSSIRAALLAWSSDGAKSWSRPRKVNDSVERVQEGESGPRIAFAADGGIYAVWSVTAGTGSILQGNVRFSMQDGKGAFAPARTLNEVKDAARFPIVEVAPDGNILAAWVDRRIDNPKPRQLYLMRLGPDGKALTKNYQIGEGACECCRIGMALGDGGRTVYVASREVSPQQIRNHALRKSSDGGASFGAPVQIGDDGWQVPFCPDSGPAIVPDERGHLHVAWFTHGRSPVKEAGVYYAVSKDGGRTFSPRHLVDRSAGWLLHATLAVGKNGAVYFAWDNIDDSNKSQIYVRVLAADGRSWSAVTQVSQARRNAARPALAVSEKNLHVAWTELAGETSWIALRSAPLAE